MTTMFMLFFIVISFFLWRSTGASYWLVAAIMLFFGLATKVAIYGQ